MRNMQQQLEYEQQIVAKVPEQKKNNAIAFLKGFIPEDDKKSIKERIMRDGSKQWIALFHFNWGMYVRNTLRKNGFGEEYFGIENLDYIYTELVEEAVLDRSEYTEPTIKNKLPYRNIIIRK